MNGEGLLPREREAVVQYRLGEETLTLRLTAPDQSVQARGLRAVWRWQMDGERVRLWLRLNNVGREPLLLDWVDVLRAPLPDLGCPVDRLAVYQNGWNSWTPTFARRLDDGLYVDPGTPTYQAMHQPHEDAAEDDVIASEWVAVLGGRSEEGAALLAGFVTLADQLAEVRVRRDGTALVARCYFDGALLRPGEGVSTETLLLQVGPGPLALLEAWAETAGREMGARVSGWAAAPTRVPTGWCTWYTYYGENTADDVLANLEAIAHYDLPLDVILLSLIHI